MAQLTPERMQKRAAELGFVLVDVIQRADGVLNKCDIIVTCKCGRGNFQIPWNRLASHQVPHCDICKEEHKHKLTDDDVRRKCQEFGVELISFERIPGKPTADSIIKIKCPKQCGGEISKTWNSFVSKPNGQCNACCGKSQRIPVGDIVKFMNDNDFELIDVDTNHNSGRNYRVTFKCKCGNPTPITRKWRQIKDRDSDLCTACQREENGRRLEWNVVDAFMTNLGHWFIDWERIEKYGKPRLFIKYWCHCHGDEFMEDIPVTTVLWETIQNGTFECPNCIQIRRDEKEKHRFVEEAANALTEKRIREHMENVLGNRCVGVLWEDNKYDSNVVFACGTLDCCNVSIGTWAHLLSVNSMRYCSTCRGEAAYNRLSDEELKQQLKKYDCEFISSSRIIGILHIDYMCKCQSSQEDKKIAHQPWNSFSKYKKCPSCIQTERCDEKTIAAIHQKRRETCLARYGFESPMQNEDVHFRNMKSRFRTKTYTSTTGKEFVCQGYEPFAIERLIDTDEYPDDDIFVGHDICKIDGMPKFLYTNLEGKQSRYFPDIYIKSDNRFIEVKADYTYNLEPDLVMLKARCVKERSLINNHGVKQKKFSICIWIMDHRGKLIDVIPV